MDFNVPAHRRKVGCLYDDGQPLAAPWPVKHLDLGEVEKQGDSGKTSAQFPVDLRPNRTLGSAGGAMSKLWAVELMRPHFLRICVLRLDFLVSEDRTSAKEALSVVRVFTASPSASSPWIPPASNRSCAQAAGSPRASAGYPSSPRLLAFLGSASSLISWKQIPSFHGWLKLIQCTQKQRAN